MNPGAPLGGWTDGFGVAEASYHALRRWRLLALASIGLVTLALFAWKNLSRAEDPVVEPMEAGVTISYPGASAEDVEAQVTKVLEAPLYAMDRVEYVESSAYPGVAYFHLKFEDGTPMDVFVERIRGIIQAKRADLPAQVKEPGVRRYSTATITVPMVIAVSGHRSDRILSENAERLRDDLASVPGVSSVDLRGGAARTIRIRLDPERLAQFHLSVDEVVGKLRETNVEQPTGEIETGSFATVLEVDHQFATVQDVMDVPVGMGVEGTQRRTVSLGEIAQVVDTVRPLTQRFLYHDGPAVALEVRFRRGEDGVAVGQRVHDRLAARATTLEDGIHVAVAYDQPAWVKQSLGTFIESLAEGVALVMAIVTLGIGWRAGAVVSTVIPLAAAGAVLGLYLFGFAIDQMSLAGLIVALGLLVDDAVVVVESIQLMRNHGLSAIRSAVLGTSRVFWANNGTTAVACAAFIPLFFMGGNIGSFIRGLPAAVVLALFTSLIVAQLVTPWLAASVVRPNVRTTPIADSTAYDKRDDAAERGEREANPFLRWLKDAYVRRIGFVVAYPGLVVFVATAALAGAIALVPRIGVQFFAKSEKPLLFVRIEMPKGTDVNATATVVSRLTREIERVAGVADASAMIGGAYPQVLLGRAPRLPSKDTGDILVRTDRSARTDEVALRLRAIAATVPEANVNVEEIYNGPGVEHPIIIRVYGDEYAKLREYADDVKSLLRAQHGTVNVSDSLSDSIPVTEVTLDASRARSLGITAAQVGTTLRYLYGDDKLTDFLVDGKTVEVTVEPPRADRRPLERVEQTPLTAAGARGIPLAAVGGVSLGHSFAQLMRRNTRRVVEIVADVEGAALPSAVLGAVDPALRSKAWAPGYGYQYAGEQEETDKSFRNLAIAAIGSLIVIVIIVIAMFDSFTMGLATTAAVPYAVIGAFSGLAIVGEPFSFMAFLGLIGLIGVYVNHKIYFVDRFLELRGRGQPLGEAIANAGADRLRPVVLTALTAVLGLLPLTLGGGSMWRGFGWVGIFGLTASIPLSLVLLPAFITIAHRWRYRTAMRDRVERTPEISGFDEAAAANATALPGQ